MVKVEAAETLGRVATAQCKSSVAWGSSQGHADRAAFTATRWIYRIFDGTSEIPAPSLRAAR
jgi:hypothetical protein